MAMNFAGNKEPAELSWGLQKRIESDYVTLCEDYMLDYVK